MSSTRPIAVRTVLITVSTILMTVVTAMMVARRSRNRPLLSYSVRPWCSPDDLCITVYGWYAFCGHSSEGDSCHANGR